MTAEPVLVAYGSKYGGTGEIAEWIAGALRDAHIPAEVREADAVHSLSGFGAVILGGGLYGGRLHRHTRRFARRFAAQLRELPLWLFGSGPLDHSLDPDSPAAAAEPMGAKAVRKTADRLGARGHMLFGGRLAADVRGFPASAMAAKMAGDYRNPDQIRAWARGVADQMARRPH